MIESVNIKDLSNIPRFSTPINEGSKRKFLLMKEDYITLKFSLDSPMYFQLGDNIDNELGIFELIDLYKPTYNTTTGAYDYELRLDAYYWKWKNKKFFYTPETTGREAAWNLTATLDTNLNVFLDNLKALGYKFREEEFTYEIDSTVENTSKLVSYDNVNLIDALTQMAETWECEWWITEHVIHFGRCEYSSPVDFKAGDLTDTENVNVNSMTRSDSQTTYATRIYAFGSTRNIPSSYRKNLIFDVKQVNGSEISDTARPLDIKYFPSRVVHKEEYPVNEGIGSGAFTTSYTEWMHDTDIVASLPAGDYKVSSGDGISINVSTVIPSIGAGRSFLPAGDYVLKASYIYKVSGVTKEVPIGNQTVTLSQDQQYEVSVTFAVASSLQIEGNATDLKIRIYTHVPSRESSILNDSFSAYVSYDITLFKGSSADATATFLSGVNSGKTFSCVYNPDHLIGDSANVIQLPSGVTASLGDRYTIDNIIKGKVPDNYFSKDDKELTLNGVIQKRLMLPEGIPYVDAYKYSPTGERINIGDENYDDPDNVEMPEEEAIEEIVTFDDEYPKYTGSISGISHEEKEEEDDDGNKTGNKYPIYTFRDNSLKNFTKDFLLEELHLIFQTGKLAGLDFALTLKESDNTGTTFEIIRNEDYGRYLPDDVLLPQAAHTENGKDIPADTYILHGFDTAYLSEQILPDSEQTLLKKAKDYVKKSMIDPSTYDCEMDVDFIYNNGNIRTYEAGDKINLINRAYFPNGRQSRIIGFEWPLDIPYDHPIYTIGETAAYSRIGEIESKIDSLTYKGQTYSGSAVGGGGTSVYIIGVNDKTLPSDRNTFSAKRIINEITERAISRTADDTASGLITFLKGIVSEGPIESNGGVFIPPFTSGVLGTGACLKRNPETGKTYLEADEIYVRLKAVFDTLEIRHTTHVGGQQILSPAGMTCLRVEEYPSFYRCFMKADDGSKAVQNLFAENDQAQCRDINVKEGIYENVSNQYYWRLVVGVGDDYIDLSKDDCDKGSTVPAAGDNICQLGNRIHKERQNAIIISSYGPDSPSFKQYAGIDSYSLEGKEVTVLSPYGNELSGKLHIQPGSTGWQSLDGLPEGIKEAADSAISGIEFGKNNLLRNSGFTGDYQTANLNSDTSLDETSELYSPSLKYWDVVNAVAQESEISMSGKEVVIKSGSMTQALFYRIISGESYIFSFYGKGTSVTFSCGGYAETIPLTDEYKRYICRFRTLSAGSILSIHSAIGSFCELQLERGTVPSSWGASMMDNTSELAHYQELEYLASAIKDGSVDILGGLVLANILQLGNYKDGRMQRVTAGISGIYNNDDDVFAFGGGTLEQAISTVAKYKDNPSYQPTDEELNSIAKIVFTHGGRTILNDVVLRGYIYALGGVFSGKVSIANEKILLNEDGSGWLANKAIMWDKDGKAYGDLFDKQYAMNTNYVELPTVPKGSIKQIILPYYVLRAILTYEIKFANQSDFIVYKEGTNTIVVTGDTQISFGKLGHGIIRLTGICFDADSSNTRWVAEDINFGLNG